MKQMLAIAVIMLSGIVLYRGYQDHLRATAEAAAAKARADVLRSIPTPAKAPATPAAPAQVLVSRKIEPTYVQLLGAVDAGQPHDLVPPIQLMKERIMDKQSNCSGAKRVIYDKAVQLAAAMEAAAEERTRSLEAMVNHSVRGRGALDNPQSSNAAAFFAQGVRSRWETEVRRRKPALDQLLSVVRVQEREWNKTADASLPPEDFEIPNISPPMITADPSASSANPLERGAYDSRRAVYPWRRSYYDQSGYRYP